MHALVLLCINQHTKFEVPSFTTKGLRDVLCYYICAMFYDIQELERLQAVK